MAARASRFLGAGLEGEAREARLREIHQQVFTNMLRFAARLAQDARPPGDPIAGRARLG